MLIIGPAQQAFNKRVLNKFCGIFWVNPKPGTNAINAAQGITPENLL